MDSAVIKDSENLVESTFAYQFLRRVLPIGACCCFIAAGVAFSFFKVSPVFTSAFVLLLGFSHLFVRYQCLPKVSRLIEVDILSAIIFFTASAGTFIGALTNDENSPVTGSLLLMFSAFAFIDTRVFFGFGIFSIGGYIAARYVGGHPIDAYCYNLVLLGPTFAVLSRIAVLSLERKAKAARRDLQNKIGELEAEKRRRLESEKHLVHAQKMEGLGLLATGVAHDFNNHLQSISGFAELISMSGKAEEYSGNIRDAARSASKICSQMLAYAGKTQDQKSVIDLNEVINESATILRVAIPKQCEIVVDPHYKPVFSMANATSLQQCVTNLVHNAADALGRRGGKIRISGSRISLDWYDNGQWRVFGTDENHFGASMNCLEVCDNGCGMDPDVLECAFDPYFTTKETGHGFGLASTLGIIRSFGGFIRCQTKSGFGTTVQLLLPCESSMPTIEARFARKCKNDFQTVLVVDDEATVRSATSHVLRAHGYDVTVAASGAEALRITKRSQFDLMILDYAMPDMNGMDLLSSLRARGISNPAVICSGFAAETIADQEGHQPDAFLSKPYEVSQILEALSGT